jgi:hypothetical protein
MTFMIPEMLKREIQHRLERLGGRMAGASLRERFNAHPLLIAGVAGLSVILLVVALAWTLWPTSSVSRRQSKTAWFCDTNTGKLFEDSSRKAGPISAPSGSASNGEPAGFRAHVYSYVMDPNESELFVGFLERPDPDAERKYASTDTIDFGRWIRGHLIRRLKDKQWVRADSPEGQAILKEQTQPNKRGQTPIYQPADRKRSGRR